MRRWTAAALVAPLWVVVTVAAGAAARAAPGEAPPSAPVGGADGERPLPPLAARRETWLEELGISFRLVSKADVLSKVRGGLSDGDVTRYRGHVDLVAEIDTKRIGLWSGGTIHVAAQNGHGQGISEQDVGDVQALSNIDAHSFTQMSEWYLEQAFLEERLRVKVGRQDAGADFACAEFGGEFLNSSFGLIPTAPVPTFPDPALGVSAFADVTDELSVGMGVYASTPINWGRIRGTTFGIEVAYSPGSAGRNASSRYRAGYWRQRDPFDARAPGVHSVYVALDRALFLEKGGDQGLRGFVQAGTTSGAPNGVSDYLGIGVVYEGLLPGRDGDSLGLGVAHARLPRGSAETDLELLYRVAPWPWLTLQPSLHWVLRPGGQGEDALVVGLRVEAQF
jgi:porin